MAVPADSGALRTASASVSRGVPSGRATGVESPEPSRPAFVSSVSQDMYERGKHSKLESC